MNKYVHDTIYIDILLYKCVCALYLQSFICGKMYRLNYVSMWKISWSRCYRDIKFILYISLYIVYICADVHCFVYFFYFISDWFDVVNACFTFDFTLPYTIHLRTMYFTKVALLVLFIQHFDDFRITWRKVFFIIIFS